MAVKLTDEQMKILEGVIHLSENFADQVYHIMQNHGLDKIEGCSLAVIVEPEALFTTKTIHFGHDINDDSGRISLAKGRKYVDEKFLPFGKNSTEYVMLFADEAVRRRIQADRKSEKPLPPDGLWVGGYCNDSPVDSRWEWDVNDSLS